VGVSPAASPLAAEKRRLPRAMGQHMCLQERFSQTCVLEAGGKPGPTLLEAKLADARDCLETEGACSSGGGSPSGLAAGSPGGAASSCCALSELHSRLHIGRAEIAKERELLGRFLGAPIVPLTPDSVAGSDRGRSKCFPREPTTPQSMPDSSLPAELERRHLFRRAEMAEERRKLDCFLQDSDKRKRSEGGGAPSCFACALMAEGADDDEPRSLGGCDASPAAAQLPKWGGDVDSRRFVSTLLSELSVSDFSPRSASELERRFECRRAEMVSQRVQLRHFLHGMREADSERQESRRALQERQELQDILSRREQGKNLRTEVEEERRREEAAQGSQLATAEWEHRRVKEEAELQRAEAEVERRRWEQQRPTV